MPLATAVIDPNVFVSALIKPRSGHPAAVVRAIDAGELLPILSPVLLAQMDSSTARPKFRRYFPLVEAWLLRGLLESRGTWHADPPAGPAISRDPGDDYLVRLYRSSSVDWLVSGDGDLIDLKLPDVLVLTPRAAAEELSQRRSRSW